MQGYLLNFDKDGTPTSLRGDRYEFWVYRQLRKRIEVGDIYIDDSVQHRRFADELVALDQKEDALKGLNIPWLAQPVDATLDGLFVELDRPLRVFSRSAPSPSVKPSSLHDGLSINTIEPLASRYNSIGRAIPLQLET